jgi:DtxR family Mn-dependent transcriptional regulator
MTFSEENYLKTIYHLTSSSNREVSTNEIAEMIATKASSVTDMLRKLAEKDLLNYKKYQGVSLTEKGKLSAKMIVRKHRLWEVFLVEKLNFSWDEVHDIAEQLEHIKSEQLINKLDDFLGNPTEKILTETPFQMLMEKLLKPKNYFFQNCHKIKQGFVWVLKILQQNF